MLRRISFTFPMYIESPYLFRQKKLLKNKIVGANADFDRFILLAEFVKENCTFRIVLGLYVAPLLALDSKSNSLGKVT